jgi:hypothetical protein
LAIDVKYFMVVKFLLNVDADTVAAPAPVLFTSGNAKATNDPAKATAARALLFLNLISFPNPSVAPQRCQICDYYMNVP